MSTIKSERASLEIEIASLETRLLSLRSQLNNLSHVNRLPSDLLLEIISLVRGTPSSNFGWVRGITDVCSHWRSIALNQRELWATVFLSAAHVKLQTPISTLLNRSNGYPLVLHAPSLLDVGGKTEAFGILPHSLRGLQVDNCTSFDRLSQYFRTSEDLQAPLLQILQFDTCADRFQKVPALVSFLSKHAPLLRSIRIPSLFFSPRDLYGLSALNITDLSLVDGSLRRTMAEAKDDTIKAYDVLAALAQFKGLTHLSLHGLYLDYYESCSSSAILELPMLTVLRLEDASIRSVLNVLQSVKTYPAIDMSCLRLMTEDRDGLTRTEPNELYQIMRELVVSMLRLCAPKDPTFSSITSLTEDRTLCLV
ncbi:hypothetical protein DL96DRAFT_1276918 [Flagelloscypha sp. PMI_526]|nr:hypothetical protein DL96DRAFT_1276918 [Flagelloscypha sp. PMI_526]